MTTRQALAEILAIRIERFNREMVNPKFKMSREDVRKALERVLEYLDSDEIDLSR